MADAELTSCMYQHLLKLLAKTALAVTFAVDVQAGHFLNQNMLHGPLSIHSFAQDMSQSVCICTNCSQELPVFTLTILLAF